jgi:hypothetical protein
MSGVDVGLGAGGPDAGARDRDAGRNRAAGRGWLGRAPVRGAAGDVAARRRTESGTGRGGSKGRPRPGSARRVGAAHRGGAAFGRGPSRSSGRRRSGAVYWGSLQESKVGRPPEYRGGHSIRRPADHPATREVRRSRAAGKMMSERRDAPGGVHDNSSRKHCNAGSGTTSEIIQAACDVWGVSKSVMLTSAALPPSDCRQAASPTTRLRPPCLAA